MTTTQQDAQVEVQEPAALLAHLQRMPMTEWVWHDAQMIFATLAALSAPTPESPICELQRLGQEADAGEEAARLREMCRANNDLARMNAKDRDEWRSKAVRAMHALEAIWYEAEREKGGWIHLKRAIAVAARAALEPQAGGE